jgi:hypothetical protein
MHRKDLPRIYELHDLHPEPGAYFHDLDRTLTEWPIKLACFQEVEVELQGIDPAAWAYLKCEVEPLLTAYDQVRGWQQLWDMLNQARGYNHLARLGCSDLRFIPRSTVGGQRTPDLEATHQGRKVLCAVKTLNISQEEAQRRYNQGVGDETDRLSQGFFDKLASTLGEAAEQMRIFDPDERVRRIAYVILKFDSSSGENADRYQDQLNCFMSENRVPGVEVRFYFKMPFAR